jgi:hypothetical protein
MRCSGSAENGACLPAMAPLSALFNFQKSQKLRHANQICSYVGKLLRTYSGPYSAIFLPQERIRPSFLHSGMIAGAKGAHNPLCFIFPSFHCPLRHQLGHTLAGPLGFLDPLICRGFRCSGARGFHAMRGNSVGRLPGQWGCCPVPFWSCLTCRRGAAARGSSPVKAWSRSRDLSRCRPRGGRSNRGAPSRRPNLGSGCRSRGGRRCWRFGDSLWGLLGHDRRDRLPVSGFAALCCRPRGW